MEDLWGDDRYKTAVAISNEGWPDGSDNVILATGENYPDALCAAPAAQILNAPILLTEMPTLNGDTEKEIERLGAENIFIVGGPGAVSEDVFKQLESKGLKCTRIWGEDRYATSVAVAEFIEGRGKAIDEIFAVDGEDYMDALSVSPVAAIGVIPIILVTKDTLPQSAKTFINNRQITKTYVIGWEDVISNFVAYQLPYPERIGGFDRYTRNISVMNRFLGKLSLDKVYIATGEDYPGS